MALPKRVQAQADEAKRIQDALSNQNPGTDQTKESPEQPALQVVTTEPKAEEQKTDEVQQSDDEFKKRFVNLKRKYDEEIVPELRHLRSENSGLQNKLSEMQREIESLKQTKTPTPETLDDVLTEKEINEYGDDLIKLMSKVSKSEMAKQILDLNSRLGNLENGQSQIKQTVEKTTINTFFSELSRTCARAGVEDWESINADPNFHAWLAEEIVPGHERQEFLQEAQDRGDVSKVAQYFIDWNASNGSSKPTQRKKPSPVPDQSGVTEAPNDESLKKIYTTAYVNQFYKDKSMGKYKGREAEARRIETDILAAGNEGRIRP